VATKRKQKQMKKATRILMLVGTFYLFGGCKPATTTDPTPTAPDYIGKWGNDNDFCSNLNENPLRGEVTVTFGTDKSFVTSGYDCATKTRYYSTFSYEISTDGIMKLKWIKSVDSMGSPVYLNAAQLASTDAERPKVSITADGKKLTFTPGLSGDIPALRTFVKR
jgi:hypothetical protein